MNNTQTQPVRKPYQTPSLEKRQQLVEVTQGPGGGNIS